MSDREYRPRAGTARPTARAAASVRTFVRCLWLAATRPQAATQALGDARRAWAIAPIRHGWSTYAGRKDGGRSLLARRGFSRREVIRLKLQSARFVLLQSARLGIADSVVVSRYQSEGLLANLLRVLEALHRVPPGATVHVDWVLRGNELGFRYGDVGDDVWPRLFRRLDPAPGRGFQSASLPVEFAFWGTGKDYLTGRALRKHRHAYHATMAKWVEVTNERVLAEVRDIRARALEGRYRIGVHRRVPNAQVADLQADGEVPSTEAFIRAVEATAARNGNAAFVVFLATDDADAVDAFRRAFGAALVVREQVQRTTRDGAEVHFRAWDRISLADAEDVLIDTILLSCCDALVHASSSVSTVAAIMNPELELVRAKAAGAG